MSRDAESRRSGRLRGSSAPAAKPVSATSRSFVQPVAVDVWGSLLLPRLVHLPPRVLILTALAMAIYVFHIHSWRNYEGPKRAALIYGVATAMGMCYLASGRYRERFVSPIGPPAQLLIFSALLSTAFSINISEGLEDLSEDIARWGLVFLLLRYTQSWHDARRHLSFIVLAGLLCGLFSVCQFYGIGSLNLIFTREPVSTLGNINYAAELFNTCMVCSVFMLLYSLGRRNHVMAGLCSASIAVMCWALYHIDSRASHVGLLGFFAAAGLIWAYYRGIGRLLSPRGFRFHWPAAAIVIGLSYPMLNLVHVGMLGRYADTHKAHTVITKALGLYDEMTARKVNPESFTAKELYHAMTIEGRPLKDVSVYLYLVPINDIHYRIAFHAAAGLFLLFWLWSKLDCAGMLGGREEGEQHIKPLQLAARLALIGACGLLACSVSLPTSRFLLVMVGGMASLVAVAAVAVLCWRGLGGRLSPLALFFSGCAANGLGLLLFSLRGNGWALGAAGGLILLFGLAAWSGLLVHWWRLPSRLAVMKPAYLTIVLCLGLVGGSLLINKACNNSIIIETMNSRLPDRVLDINTILFRFEVWKKTIQMICDNTLVGIGAGNFKTVEELYTSQAERNVLGKEVLARQPHNTLLSYIVEYGVFGALAYFWLLAAFLRMCFALVRFGSRRCNYEVAPAFASHREEAAFYAGLIGIGTVTATFLNDLFGQAILFPGQSTAYWSIIGTVCGVGVVVLRPQLPARAWEANEAHPVAIVDRLLPPFSKQRYAVLSVAVLLLVSLPMMQFIGEVHLRRGMIQRDVLFFEGKDPTTRKMWGERSLFMYLWKRYLPYPMEKMYEQFGAFDHFRHCINTFPWQMETYYILGRYYIDAVQELLDAQTMDAASNAKAEEEFYINKLSQLLYTGIYTVNDIRDEMVRLGYRDAYFRLSGLSAARKQEYVENGIATYYTDLYMNPNYKWGHNNLGVLMDRNNDVHGSRASYLRALILDPEQIYAHFNLALGHLREGNYATAAMYFENSFYTEPNKWEAYRYAASCYERAGDAPSALRMYELYFAAQGVLDREYAQHIERYRPRVFARPYALIDAIGALRDKSTLDPAQLDPDAADNVARLAQLYENMERFAEADKAYELAYLLDPSSESNLRAYASRLLAQRKWQEALTLLQRLERAEEQSPGQVRGMGEVFYELGRASAHLGLYEQASFYLRRALALQPALERRLTSDLDLWGLIQQNLLLRDALGEN